MEVVGCCSVTSTETVGLLGTGAQDGHLDFHTAPELWNGGGGRGRLYTYRYTVTTRTGDSCIKTGSDESHFNVSLIVRG